MIEFLKDAATYVFAALGIFLCLAGLGAGLAFGVWILGKACHQW